MRVVLSDKPNKIPKSPTYIDASFFTMSQPKPQQLPSHCTTPSMPTMHSRGPANKKAVSKQNINDILSEPEGNVLTKKSKPLTGTGQCQQQWLSAPPVTPPSGPRKRTNEHPGLIGKKGRCTKAEVAVEKAKKEEKAKAVAAAKVGVMAQLVEMEVIQEAKEAMRHQQILRRQPSVLDVLADAADDSGEEVDWGTAGDTDIESSSQRELTPMPASSGLSAVSKQKKVSTLY